MRPAREQYRNSGQTYFVTAPTAQRRPIFHYERWALLMQEVLEHYRGNTYFLHAYVLMPDHLHALLSPHGSVENAMRNIKGGYSFRARKAFEWRYDIWQTGYADHRIRDLDDWNHHITYMRQNPEKANLGEGYRYLALELDPIPPRFLEENGTINATQE